MKAFLIGSAVAALAAGIAIAQPAPPQPPGVAQGTAPLPPRAPMPPRAPEGERVMHVQVMSEHIMTRDEVAAHVRKMFDRLDANHDGYVTREEANAFLGQMGDMRERMEGMRQRMDGMRERTEKVRFKIENRFEVRGDEAEGRGALFDKLDTNHDGVISRQEFMNGRAHMHENRMIVMRDGADGIPPVPPIPPIPPMPDMKVMHMPMHAMGDGMGGFGARLFEIADTNHDGRVSLQEAEAAALAHFDRADLNHDGRITPDERQQVRTIRIERRPS
jgi:Ca2+-binding EF-hand superfamily protein